MTTTSTNWDCDGVVDVGIIVMAHVDNPIQEHALNFLKRILAGTKQAAIPTTTFLGAYHVMTSYLDVAQDKATHVLTDTINQQTNAFYEHVRTSDTRLALTTASTYNVESWDAYLLAAAKRLDTDNIYSIDKTLQERATEYTVVTPFSQEKIRQYHEYLKQHT